MPLATGLHILEAARQRRHGASFAAVIQAICHGFTSVMIDGSEQPYADNVAVTRRVVEADHAAVVSVEAEIGHVGGVEDDQGSMHGGSGVPAEQVHEAVSAGICKVNVATELKEAWAGALRETLAQLPDESDPRKLMSPPRAAVQAVVREKIRFFGSAGKA